MGMRKFFLSLALLLFLAGIAGCAEKSSAILSKEIEVPVSPVEGVFRRYRVSTSREKVEIDSLSGPCLSLVGSGRDEEGRKVSVWTVFYELEDGQESFRTLIGEPEEEPGVEDLGLILLFPLTPAP